MKTTILKIGLTITLLLILASLSDVKENICTWLVLSEHIFFIWEGVKDSNGLDQIGNPSPCKNIVFCWFGPSTVYYYMN